MLDGSTKISDFIASERERLTIDGDALIDKRDRIDEQLAGIEREFVALEAYEAAKTGKASTPAVVKGGGKKRVRRGSRREQLIDLIGQNDGLSRGEILDRLALKGDRAGENAVSVALTALIKMHHIQRDDGRYYAAPGLTAAA